MLLGTELSPEVQREALRRFVYRMTVESVRQYPALAEYMYARGYKLPLITDDEWLAITEFHVTNSGSLDKRYNHCYSKR